MGRPLRIERAGGWYHVTGRGNEGKAIYRDKRDRLHFLELMAEMVGGFRVVLHGYHRPSAGLNGCCGAEKWRDNNGISFAKSTKIRCDPRPGMSRR